MNLPPLPTPYYPQWSHSNEFAAFTSDQVRQAQRDAVSELAIASDARIAGLQDQINRDSVELRSLCQARDDARKERDAAKAMASELEKDRDYCEKQWHEALASHENIEALKSRIAELEAALRQAMEVIKTTDNALRKAWDNRTLPADAIPSTVPQMAKASIAAIHNLLKD